MIHLASSKIRVAPAPRNGAYARYDDSYRAPMSVVEAACTERGWFCFGDLMKQTKVSEGRRSIIPTYNTVGLSSFAVSNRGARRLLYYLSYKELVDTLDLSIADAFQKGNLRGWTVIPPLMAEWKTNGIGDSDLKKFEAGFPIGDNKGGSSAAMHWSVRGELAQAMEGEDYWKNEEANWKLAAQRAASPDADIEFPGGRPSGIPVVTPAVPAVSLGNSDVENAPAVTSDNRGVSVANADDF